MIAEGVSNTFERELASCVSACGGITAPGGLRAYEHEDPALFDAEVGQNRAGDGDGTIKVGTELAVQHIGLSYLQHFLFISHACML